MLRHVLLTLAGAAAAGTSVLATTAAATADPVPGCYNDLVAGHHTPVCTDLPLPYNDLLPRPPYPVYPAYPGYPTYPGAAPTPQPPTTFEHANDLLPAGGHHN